MKELMALEEERVAKKHAIEQPADAASSLSVAPPPGAEPPIAEEPMAAAASRTAWGLPGGPRTLAFPSLSTGSTYQFDIHRAASTCVREVAKFLRDNEEADIALLLVEGAGEARDALVAAAAAEPGLPSDSRFAIAGESASLVALSSTTSTPARFLCNPANHRLNAKGGGLNKAMHTAAGAEALEGLTHASHTSGGQPGSVYPVALPIGNPLREAHGVEYVLHCVGPNMNPDKPMCLEGDYSKGCEQLAETYAALLKGFHELASAVAVD